MNRWARARCVCEGLRARPRAAHRSRSEIGGEFNAFTSKEYTSYSSGAPREVALDVLVDMLRQLEGPGRDEKGVIMRR